MKIPHVCVCACVCVKERAKEFAKKRKRDKLVHPPNHKSKKRKWNEISRSAAADSRKSNHVELNEAPVEEGMLWCDSLHIPCTSCLFSSSNLDLLSFSWMVLKCSLLIGQPSANQSLGDHTASTCSSYLWEHLTEARPHSRTPTCARLSSSPDLSVFLSAFSELICFVLQSDILEKTYSWLSHKPWASSCCLCAASKAALTGKSS